MYTLCMYITINLLTWNQMKMLLCLTGKVYAVGGHDGNEHLGSMEMFDPFTNKWMMKASMNTKR